MQKRRFIIYFVLVLFEFLTSFYFILFPIRWAIIHRENVELLYWEMRIVIVLINIIVAFWLASKHSKKFKLLLGLSSGIGLQLLFYPLSIHTGSEIIAIIIIASEYILQVIALEFTIRYKDKHIAEGTFAR